uniref:Uncharacterized protein n=2 Tax=Hemiselmis andersenii TaxID=464988 RepID=A0A6U4JV24_HEMAN
MGGGGALAKGGAVKAKLNNAPTAANSEKKAKEKAKENKAKDQRAEALKLRMEKSISSMGSAGPASSSKDKASGFATLTGAEMEDVGDVNAGMINVKRTIAEMDRWPGIVQGYTELGLYSCFVCLYVIVLLMQLDVGPSYAIDTMIRNNLLDQGDKLAAVASHGDIFAYLLQSYSDGNFEGEETEPMGGVLGDMFADKWYNDDPIPADESGYLFGYNRLIGGVQIEQKRGYKGGCTGDSLYSVFYPQCYNDTYITADPPFLYFNETTGKDVYDLTDATFLQQVEDSKFGDRTLLDDASGDYYGSVRESFEYNYTIEGYRVFLDLAKGTTFNLKKISQLREMRWLDRQTRDIIIKFTFYNGNFRRFAFAQVAFKFDQGGQFIRFDPESAAVQHLVRGGTSVLTASIKMEPYIVPEDFLRLGLEIVFMIWTFIYITNFVRTLIVAAVTFKLRDHLNSWMILDLGNYLCFVMYFVMRVNLMRYVVNNMVEVPTNSYQPVFQIAAAMTRTQLKVNFVNCLLCIFRFFKFYQFQPRLQIVNKTLAASTVNLYHFCVIFFVIFLGFAVIGNIMFGGQYRDFHTIPNAMQALFETLSAGNFDLGPTVGNSLLTYPNNAVMGIIFFVSWIFICAMVLLNVFVAILMDSYAAAQEEGEAQAKRVGLDKPQAVGDDIGKAIGIMSRTLDPRSWKYTEANLYHALSHLDKTMLDPEDKSFYFKKEKERLEEEKDKITERLEELEILAEDPQEQLFHPAWNQKSVTMAELARTLPKVSKTFRSNNPDENTMEAVWQTQLYFAPEDDTYVEEDEERDIVTLREKLTALIKENAALRNALAEPS